MAKQTIKQRKAIRSAAAKKGAREMVPDDIGTAQPVPAPVILQANTWEEVRALSRTLKPHVTIEIPKGAPLHPSLWQRIKRWWA